MTKKMFLIVFFSIVINIVIKGDDLERTENESLTRIVFRENDRKSNWFLSLGTGVNTYLKNSGSSTPLRKRITLNYNFAVGKWISPILGLRFAVAGGKIHTSSVNDLHAMNSITYFNTHADLLFNLSNYITPSLNRKYSFIPNIGMGYIRGDSESNLFKTNGFNGPIIKAGLLNAYRFSDRISAYVELNASLVESKFDRQNREDDNKNNWCGIVSLNVGILMNLGKTGLKKIEPQDLSEFVRLNDIINRLQEEGRGCRMPPPCPPIQDCPPPAQTSNIYCAFPIEAVFFRINSHEVELSQYITLYNFSILLKNNQNIKLELIGYADKETGSKDYNLKLSKKRAENVANLLVNKYGIERDRLKIEPKGSTLQPYKEKEWNRVVVIRTVYE